MCTVLVHKLLNVVCMIVPVSVQQMQDYTFAD